MKKYLLAAISFGLAFTFSACSDDSSSGASSNDDSSSIEDGAYGKVQAVDKDAKKILEEAVKGTDYEDATCDSVSTQVVAGTNYMFQCTVKDGKKTKDVVLTVFEPLPSSDDPVQLTLVTDSDGEVLYEQKVEFEDEDGEESEDPEDVDSEEDGGTGGYEKLESSNEDVYKILEEAIKGTDYEKAECDSFALQIVAGTNYKFQCSIKDGKKTKDVVLTVFEPLPYTKKSPVLTLVTDADGKVLFEAEVAVEDEGSEDDESEAVEPKDDEKSETADAKDDEKSEKADAKDDEKSKNEKSDEGDDESDEGDDSEMAPPAADVDECDGCYSSFEELTAADSAVFEKVNEVSDSTFVNPSAVSKQVVAGTNYRFKCELQISDDETKEVVLEVYKNLEGEVEITSVAEVSEEPLQEKLDPSSFEILPGAEGLVSDCGNSNGGAVTNCDVKLVHEN
ncbi:hypothetical protein [Fibrobacter sp.]|uniref:hypothetical protein n=1 Tax=Fibrobacter sp. TaxID=35828 RepID=UPI00388FC12F